MALQSEGESDEATVKLLIGSQSHGEVTARRGVLGAFATDAKMRTACHVVEGMGCGLVKESEIVAIASVSSRL